MAIAMTLKEYFENEDIHYDTIKHRKAFSSLDSSRTAHLPAEKVAKAVVLQSDDGEYLMASLPANSHVSLTEIYALTGKHYHLVDEQSLKDLFPDCSIGAIPAMGMPYNMSMFIDESLLAAEFIYIESGDHENLLKLSHREFSDLVSKMPHGHIRGANIGAPRLWERTGRNWPI